MTALVVFNDQIELAKLQFGNFGFSGVTEKKLSWQIILNSSETSNPFLSLAPSILSFCPIYF